MRGAKKDAEACYKYLGALNKELCANNYRLEVPIFKQLPQFLQGKDSIKNVSKVLVKERERERLSMFNPRVFATAPCKPDSFPNNRIAKLLISAFLDLWIY